VPAAAPSDAEIRERLLTELNRRNWAPLATINVIVRDGVVELWGTHSNEREHRALLVAAENIAGVKGVRDHLAWVEPNTGMVVYSEEDEAKAKAS
jgi:osmotically-inducible protein OsmY